MSFENFIRILIFIIAVFVYVIAKAYNKSKKAEETNNFEKPISPAKISSENGNWEQFNVERIEKNKYSESYSSIDETTEQNIDRSDFLSQSGGEIYTEKENEKLTIFQKKGSESLFDTEKKTLIEVSSINEKKSLKADYNKSVMPIKKIEEPVDMREIVLDISADSIIQGVLYKEILERRGGRK